MTHQPYLLKAQDDVLLLFATYDAPELDDFFATFAGMEYESDNARFAYIAGTDAYVAIDDTHGKRYLTISDWHGEEYFRCPITPAECEAMAVHQNITLILTPDYLAEAESKTRFSGKNLQTLDDVGAILQGLERAKHWQAYDSCGYILCFFNEAEKAAMQREV